MSGTDSPNNPHVVHAVDALVVHGLRRDQDVLTAHGASSSSNHHRHANVAVHAVHEHVTTAISMRGRTVFGLATHNSSRQRIGEPMASQSESNKQIVENDFSPPDSVFVCLPAALLTVISG